MTKHAVSHGGATLVTGVVGALIADEVRYILPNFTGALDELSFLIIQIFNLHHTFDVHVVSALLLASLLALAWGVAFALITGAHRQRSFDYRRY